MSPVSSAGATKRPVKRRRVVQPRSKEEQGQPADEGVVQMKPNPLADCVVVCRVHIEAMRAASQRLAEVWRLWEAQQQQRLCQLLQLQQDAAGQQQRQHDAVLREHAGDTLQIWQQCLAISALWIK